MHNQNNGSIVFNFVFWLLRKKVIDVYVAVCSEFIAEWGCPCPCQAKGQEAPALPPPPPRAVENLSTNLFVKEYFAQV